MPTLSNEQELDDILDIPNILRMASEKGSDVASPDRHIQLRIVFYDGNTETYPITLSYDLVKQAILSKLESIEQEAVDRERNRLTAEAYQHERKKMSEYIDTIRYPSIRVYRQVGDITYVDQIKDIDYGGQIITVVVEGKG